MGRKRQQSKQKNETISVFKNPQKEELYVWLIHKFNQKVEFQKAQHKAIF